MTKPVIANKKPRKQHTPEFRQNVLKIAERCLRIQSQSHVPGDHNWRVIHCR